MTFQLVNMVVYIKGAGKRNGMKFNLGRIQVQWGGGKAKATIAQIQSASNLGGGLGVGTEWAPETYGRYYATSVPAYRAVKLRADAVAGARLLVYQRRGAEKPVPVAENHPAQVLLDKVNPWWTGTDLWRATETNLCLWGSAYWWLQREEGKVVAIWPLRPDKVQIVPGGGLMPNEYIRGYLYTGNKTVALAIDEVVWFKYFNPLDEYAGMAPIAAARLSLDMGKDALRFHRNQFRKGAAYQNTVFSVQGPVTDEQANDFFARLEKRQADEGNLPRPLLWDLSQGPKPERFGLSPADLAVLQGLNYTVEDAARIWGVPPPKLYSQLSSIYNNVKQADIEFYTDTVSTEWPFLASEVNEMLLPIIAPDQDLFVAFDTSKVLPLQEALAVQKTADLLEVTTGTMTINEFREKYNREPVAWGDVFWKPFALMPASDETAQGGNPLALNPGGAGPNAGLALPGGKGYVKEQERALTAFEQRLRFADAKFEALQRRLFVDQEQDILVRLRAHKVERQLVIGSPGLAVDRQVDDSIFNQDEWVVRYKRRGLPLLTEVLTLSAQGQAAEFALGAFDPTLVSVKAWLDARTECWAQRVNLETAQLLMQELAEARAQGESIAQIQQRVEKVFRYNDMVRTERIARTETLAASNQGHLAVYEQSGVVEEKMWLATLDERVRAAHAQAHRQVVPLGGQFMVGGEFLEAPGIGGSAENVINCRCTTIPILTRRSYVLPERSNGHEPTAKELLL